MGRKGAKLTSDAEFAARDLEDRLSALESVSSKKMFGGFGFFADNKMFAIVDSSGAVFLKADDKNLSTFETAGSTKHGRMPYYSVPDDIISDEKKLLKWARESIRAASEK